MMKMRFLRSGYLSEDTPLQVIDDRMYYLVGLDPQGAPDGTYVLDRWEIVHCTFPGQAVTKYVERQQIPSVDVHAVEIWAISPEPMSVITWQYENVTWDGNRAKVNKRPLGEVTIVGKN